MSISSWSDFYNSQDHWFEHNVASLDIINLLNEPTADLCIANLVEYNELVAVTIDQITGDLILFHHVTKIGKYLKKKAAKKYEKVVALSGFGSLASIVRLPSSDQLFHKKFIVIEPVPDDDKIEQMENNKSFTDLKADPTNSKTFRNFILLPPFLVSAILALSHYDAASIANSVLAARACSNLHSHAL